MQRADDVLRVARTAQHLRLAMPADVGNKLRPAIVANEQPARLLPAENHVIAVVRHQRRMPGVRRPGGEQMLPFDFQNLRIEVPRRSASQPRNGILFPGHPLLETFSAISKDEQRPKV